MKKIIIICAVITTVAFADCSQTLNEAEVPGEVKAAFAKKYPGITAKWEKEDVKFEAEFKQNGEEMSAVFEANGTMTESEISINVTDLPATAVTYVKENYEGKPIKEAAKITNADGTVNYEAEVDDKDVIFDAAGNFLKEIKD